MPHPQPHVRFVQIACICGALLASGCASILHSGNRTITITTEPAGAKATISKATGEVVTVQTTPCTVSLDPKRGYFKGQQYLLRLELAGFQPTELQLKPSVSGWYFGNILFGGLIGLIAVDPVTGSMWNIKPDKIQQKLTPSQVSLIKDHSGFVVVTVGDLTPGERETMVRLH